MDNPHCAVHMLWIRTHQTPVQDAIPESLVYVPVISRSMRLCGSMTLNSVYRHHAQLFVTFEARLF